MTDSISEKSANGLAAASASARFLPIPGRHCSADTSAWLMSNGYSTPVMER